MRKKLFYQVVFLLLTVIVGTAHASIIYLSDDRFIDHSLNTGGPITPSPAFSDFNSSLVIGDAGASQNTTLTESTMFGSGSTYASGNGDNATSDFSVTFSVDQLTDFSLTGSIETHWFLNSSVGVSLQVNGISTNFFSFTDSDVSNEGVSPFSFNGQFSPDNSYTLDLWSYAGESGDFNQDWGFDLATSSAVPIPASAWLLVSGLVGLIGVARQRTF